jgi:hypothetical protein
MRETQLPRNFRILREVNRRTPNPVRYIRRPKPPPEKTLRFTGSTTRPSRRLTNRLPGTLIVALSELRETNRHPQIWMR